MKNFFLEKLAFLNVALPYYFYFNFPFFIKYFGFTHEIQKVMPGPCQPRSVWTPAQFVNLCVRCPLSQQCCPTRWDSTISDKFWPQLATKTTQWPMWTNCWKWPEYRMHTKCTKKCPHQLLPRNTHRYIVGRNRFVYFEANYLIRCANRLSRQKIAKKNSLWH